MKEALTIARCLRKAAEFEGLSDSARLDVELLLADVLGKARSYLYTWPEKSLTASEEEAFTQLLNRRKLGEPIAQILGKREFWSLSLAVDKSTLIPRPETELLVQIALEELPKQASHILDLGTGTGAIALALASERPESRIVAVDKNPAAVKLAIENCRRLGFKNVEITRSDWFSNLGGQVFDVIVANPPYIDAADPHLQQGDVRFEPHTALVAEEGGLADLRHIIDEARHYLAPEGRLLLEHGFAQGKHVRSLFQEAGYDSVETRQDLAGRDRVSLGRFPFQANTEEKPQ